MYPRHRARLLTILALAIGAASEGCGGRWTIGAAKRAQPSVDPAAVSLTRIHRAHPDIDEQARIAVWDFSRRENRGRLELSEAVATQPSTVFDYQRRALSGARFPGGLKVRLPPGGRLVFSPADSIQGRLPVDWTQYALLLVSIYSEAEPAQLSLAVRDSFGGVWQRTLDLHSSWNALRVDLADVSVAADVSSIAGIELASVGGEETPQSLWIDDLALADNRRDLLVGAPERSTDRTEAFTRGDRIVVRVPDRFELSFGRGVVVSWRAPGAGQCAPPMGLGPWPIATADSRDMLSEQLEDADFSTDLCGFSVVEHRQRLAEASEFRVVVDTETLLDRRDDDGDDAIVYRRYTIYPDGAVYVRVKTAGLAAKLAGDAGLAIALNENQGLRPGASSERGRRFILCARPQAGAVALMWAPASAADGELLADISSLDERRRVIAMRIAASEGGELDAATVIRVLPSDASVVAAATESAAAYQTSAAVVLSAGYLRRDARGDLNRDGFNESEGLYELSADAGLLRFRFDPGATRRSAPRFRVRGARGRRCWIYADGRIVTTQERDADGEVLFTIPQTIGEPAAVEVLLR